MSRVTEKLIRPLHRQRTRRRSRAVVLNGAQLAEHYGVPVVELETYLDQNALNYHKDSRGEIWASIVEPI